MIKVVNDMKYKILIIISVLLFMGVSLLPMNSIKAISNKAGNELNKLSIDVIIESDGSATIIEKRNMLLYEGTENKIAIDTKGNIEISDFKVYEKGKEYKFVDKWDETLSLKQKSFLNGIIKEENVSYLVWGISEYGKNTYTLVYKVDNFIKQLKDSQIMLWEFVRKDSEYKPDKIYLTIKVQDPFKNKKGKVWLYGVEGKVEVRNNIILTDVTKPLSSDENFILLTKFGEDKFESTDIINRTFEEVKHEVAKENKLTNDTIGIGEKVFDYVKIPLLLFITAVILVSIINSLCRKQEDNRKISNTTRSG